MLKIYVLTFTTSIFLLITSGTVFECKDDVPYILEGEYPCQCLSETNNTFQYNETYTIETLEEKNTLICDLSLCSDKPIKKENCTVGAMWKRGCNDCFCRTVGVICSKRPC